MQEPFKRPPINSNIFLPDGGVQVFDGRTSKLSELRQSLSLDKEPSRESVSLTAIPILNAGIESTSSGNTIEIITAVRDAYGNIKLAVIPDYDMAPKHQDTLTNAANKTDTYTVPAGKAWLISYAGWDRANAGTGSIYFTDVTTTHNFTAYITAVASQVGYVPFTGFWMKAGDSISIKCDAAAAANIVTWIQYVERTL